MNRLQQLRGRTVSRYSLDQYAQDLTEFVYGGHAYPIQQTLAGKQQGETIDSNYAGIVTSAYKRNGVVFACQVARLLLFSEARFQFQQIRHGRPGERFGTDALGLLEKPWVNGSTGELLARMIQDVDLAGNAYIRRTGPLNAPRLERLRPDRVTIVLGSNTGMLNAEVIGYMYDRDGMQKDFVSLDRSEVAHWAPIPDPLATYRGMSWITSVVREIRADGAATDHKLQFFVNGATPNMVVKFDPSVTMAQIEAFKAIVESQHQGVRNAYKTMYLGGGPDVTVVGNSFEQMSFKTVQGAGETRIAAAAGVPPVIVGLSEGLAAATYSNYAQARRRFADGTIRPLWRSCSAALENIIDVPNRARLWYDDRDIPFLQEDQKDAAEIQSVKVSTITNLVREGFTPESAVAAVNAEDLSLLQHTGRLSVQLKDPEEPEEPAGSELNGQSNGQISQLPVPA